MGEMYMEPAAMRRIAERILGDFQFSLDSDGMSLSTDLDASGPTISGAPSGGYIHGRSRLGAYHNVCVSDMQKMLADIGTGYKALANVLAAIAEDYQAEDEDAGRTIAGTLPYFSPDQPTN